MNSLTYVNLFIFHNLRSMYVLLKGLEELVRPICPRRSANPRWVQQFFGYVQKTVAYQVVGP